MRRISDHNVADLHRAIQLAMGWGNSRHQFHIDAKDFGVEHEGGVGFSDGPAKVHRADFGFRLRERFLCEYDASEHTAYAMPAISTSRVDNSMKSRIMNRCSPTGPTLPR